MKSEVIFTQQPDRGVRIFFFGQWQARSASECVFLSLILFDSCHRLSLRAGVNIFIFIKMEEKLRGLNIV